MTGAHGSIEGKIGNMEKTKALVIKEPGIVKVEMIPIPRIGGPARLMRVRACAVCGSDVRYVRGENSWALLTLGKGNEANPANIVLGHEFAGTIHENGKDVAVFANARKGCQTCEYCMGGREPLCPNLKHYGHGAGWGEMDYYPGGMSEYTEVWEDRIHYLSEGLDFEEAAFIEPTSIAIHCVRAGHVQPGQEVAVLGLGTIGLLSVQIARMYGAARVFGVDISETPLRVGEQMGCAETIDARRHDPSDVISDRTKGKGVDTVLCSLDTAENIVKALRMVKRGGTLVLAYGPHEHIAFPFTDMCGERTIVTVVGYTEAEQGLSIRLISNRAINVEALITHRFALDDAEEALAVASMKDKFNAITVMIRP